LTHLLNFRHGEPFSDPSLYRSGALQYLTLTCPELSFAVQQASLFMLDPRLSHYNHIKCILPYLKGTLDHGFHINTSPPTLTAYSDADWAGCPDTRRSTSGFCVFLGNNLIS
jgi:histone deacetylase 1/2